MTAVLDPDGIVYLQGSDPRVQNRHITFRQGAKVKPTAGWPAASQSYTGAMSDVLPSVVICQSGIAKLRAFRRRLQVAS